MHIIGLVLASGARVQTGFKFEIEWQCIVVRFTTGLLYTSWIKHEVNNTCGCWLYTWGWACEVSNRFTHPAVSLTLVWLPWYNLLVHLWLLVNPRRRNLNKCNLCQHSLVPRPFEERKGLVHIACPCAGGPQINLGESDIIVYSSVYCPYSCTSWDRSLWKRDRSPWRSWRMRAQCVLGPFSPPGYIRG